MTRSGAAEQPEPARSPFRIIHPLLSAFWTAAQRLALSAGAWALRLPQWWKHLAAEMTIDLRPHATKQIRKSKTKSKGRSVRPGASC
jgi:hypothetical protein